MGLLIRPPIVALLPESISPAFLAGIIVGYIAYDMIHYFIHHSTPSEGYWKGVKVYHLQHHYKNGTSGYGVSQKFWDLVFDTELKL